MCDPFGIRAAQDEACTGGTTIGVGIAGKISIGETMQSELFQRVSDVASKDMMGSGIDIAHQAVKVTIAIAVPGRDPTRELLNCAKQVMTNRSSTIKDLLQNARCDLLEIAVRRKVVGVLQIFRQCVMPCLRGRNSSTLFVRSGKGVATNAATDSACTLTTG